MSAPNDIMSDKLVYDWKFIKLTLFGAVGKVWQEDWRIGESNAANQKARQWTQQYQNHANLWKRLAVKKTNIQNPCGTC